MKTITLWVFENIIWDDVVVAVPMGDLWSQICSECAHNHELDDSFLDEAGGGICGVVGCSREADYYVDFTPEAKPFFVDETIFGRREE